MEGKTTTNDFKLTFPCLSLLFCRINFRSQWLEDWFSFYAYLGPNQDHFLFPIIPTSDWERQTRLARRSPTGQECIHGGIWNTHHQARYCTSTCPRGPACTVRPGCCDGWTSVSSQGSVVLKHLLFLQIPSSFLRVI